MKGGEVDRIKNDNLLELLNSDADVVECDWHVIDAVEQNVKPITEAENNGNTSNTTVVHSSGDEVEEDKQNMFNYSSTQKWSRAIDNKDDDTLRASKKSKWECYT